MIGVLTDYLYLQLKVAAYDSEKPQLRETADVTINVQRNLNGPQFFPKTEIINLPVNTDPNFWSMTQNVSDPDSVCIKREAFCYKKNEARNRNKKSAALMQFLNACLVPSLFQTNLCPFFLSIAKLFGLSL